MKITIVVQSAVVVALLASLSQAEVTVNGSRINEFFDYTAASFPRPAGGLGGVPEDPSHQNLAIETGTRPAIQQPRAIRSSFVVLTSDFGDRSP